MIIFGFISSFPVSSQVPFFALHVTRLKCLPLDVSFFAYLFSINLHLRLHLFPVCWAWKAPIIELFSPPDSRLQTALSFCGAMSDFIEDEWESGSRLQRRDH